MRFGIPAAELIQGEDGSWYSICPECGKWCKNEEMKDAESFTHREYAAHIAAEHPDA